MEGDVEGIGSGEGGNDGKGGGEEVEGRWVLCGGWGGKDEGGIYVGEGRIYGEVEGGRGLE